jgi:hypothetical protein
MGCGCSGCASGGGCLDLVSRKKKALQGLPFDMRSYLASGQAHQVEVARANLQRALLGGGIDSLKVAPYVIQMDKWFSEKRDYLVARYRAVQVYILIAPFGRDLYASWISFFNLGCLQRLARLGSVTPAELDVDDLEMFGLAVDGALGAVLDELLRRAGTARPAAKTIRDDGLRKRFVKT